MKILRQFWIFPALSILFFSACTTGKSLPSQIDYKPLGSPPSANIILDQSHESGIYKKGDQLRLMVSLRKPADYFTLKVRRDYSQQSSLNKIKYTGPGQVIFQEKLNDVSSLIFEVSTSSDTASLGLVVDPLTLKPSTERPKDFDAFWNSQKKQLRALPVEIKSALIPNRVQGYDCYDMEINCTGPRPARGYFAKPQQAKPGSLPIVLYLHAAGVKGSWCRSEPGNALRYAKQGALSFDLNAHGMLNGQPDSYYADLENGELKDYAKIGIENRDDYYFKGMYLRLMRTLDYLTSLPEWDGKRILVIGESQGGGQALAAAGLDHRVTAVVAMVPAMCDWGATLKGSKGAWPNPFAQGFDQQKVLATVPYFDAAHLLKGSKAKMLVEIGLIDNTCPSTAVYAAVNKASGEKVFIPLPYRGHHLDQKAYQDIYDATVTKVKDTFITEYLK